MNTMQMERMLSTYPGRKKFELNYQESTVLVHVDIGQSEVMDRHLNPQLPVSWHAVIKEDLDVPQDLVNKAQGRPYILGEQRQEQEAIKRQQGKRR